MKVLVLQGSPRKNGNTEQVVKKAMAPLIKAGHKVEDVRVSSLKISGCRECFACQKVTDKPACAVKDDMIPLFGKIMDADLVLIAAPVFCWGLAAQIKAVMDRCYCFFKFKHDPYKVLIEGKKFALIVTAGGDEFDGAELCVAGFEKFAEYSRLQTIGRLVIANVNNPRDVSGNPQIHKRAKEFGRKLLESLSD